MIQKLKGRYTIGLLLPLLLTACNGDGVNLGASDEGSLLGNFNDVDQLSDMSMLSNTVRISGRVADGYIQGATVCVDLNENNHCDLDEPFAVTGEGADKPIVADIPPEAIDEDTGEAIGEPLVFVAPPGRTDFLSPLTTLVHHELQSNPSLNVDEAESAVKGVLGIDDASISLFADYVAMSDSESSTEAEAAQFQYLHDTARVVVSSMINLESQVNSAVALDGTDVEGQSDIDRAIQNIVRNEVRDLLPEIAYLVAEMIAESAQVNSDSVAVEESPEDFDPTELASTILPTLSPDTINEQVEAIREPGEFVDTALQEVLTDGVYWVEFACPDEHSESNPQSEVMFDELLRRECDISYGKAQTNVNGDTLATESYLFNSLTGTWVATERQVDMLANNYSLANGQWLQAETDRLEGTINFVNISSAMVANDFGTSILESISLNLDGAQITDHLISYDAESTWGQLADSTDIFSTGAQLHQLTVRDNTSPYILHLDRPLTEDCSLYNGNCNLVKTVFEGARTPSLGLDSIRESSLTGVQIAANTEALGEVVLSLTSDIPEDGGFPERGQVALSFQASESIVTAPGSDISTVSPEELALGVNEPLISADLLQVHLECIAESESAVLVPELVDIVPTDFFAPGEFEGTPEELMTLLNSEGNSSDTGTADSTSAEDLADEQSVTLNEHNCDELLNPVFNDISIIPNGFSVDIAATDIDDDLLVSTWDMIVVDGVEMIEIPLPNVLRSDSEGEIDSILLIEHDGFVRVGSRLPEGQLSRVLTYNENAFVTLRSIIESELQLQ